MGSDRLRIERDVDGLLVLLTAEGFEVAIVRDGALLADLLTLLPPEVARPAVRAYLARDPEAAAKVAGAWERTETRSRRWTPCRRLAAEAWLFGNDWCLQDDDSTPFPTREAAEAAVDALLAEAGWCLATGEVERGK